MSNKTISYVNKHQRPWISGEGEKSNIQSDVSDEKTVSEFSNVIATANPAPPAATPPTSNPTGPRTNFLLETNSTLTSSQKKTTKTVRFPTTIDDGGTMGAGRRRGRYSPPPSPPRTTRNTISGDMREGEGEAPVVLEMDAQGSVDEKPVAHKDASDQEAEDSGKKREDKTKKRNSSPSKERNSSPSKKQRSAPSKHHR